MNLRRTGKKTSMMKVATTASVTMSIILQSHLINAFTTKSHRNNPLHVLTPQIHKRTFSTASNPFFSGISTGFYGMSTCNDSGTIAATRKRFANTLFAYRSRSGLATQVEGATPLSKFQN